MRFHVHGAWLGCGSANTGLPATGRPRRSRLAAEWTSGLRRDDRYASCCRRSSGCAARCFWWRTVRCAPAASVRRARPPALSTPPPDAWGRCRLRQRARRGGSARSTLPPSISPATRSPARLVDRMGQLFLTGPVVNDDRQTTLRQRGGNGAIRFHRPALRSPARARVEDRESPVVRAGSGFAQPNLPRRGRAETPDRRRQRLSHNVGCDAIEPARPRACRQGRPVRV